jgi:hypothetical protein
VQICSLAILIEQNSVGRFAWTVCATPATGLHLTAAWLPHGPLQWEDPLMVGTAVTKMVAFQTPANYSLCVFPDSGELPLLPKLLPICSTIGICMGTSSRAVCSLHACAGGLLARHWQGMLTRCMSRSSHTTRPSPGVRMALWTSMLSRTGLRLCGTS